MYDELHISGGSCGNAVWGKAHHDRAVLTDIEAGVLIYGGEAAVVGREEIGEAVGVFVLINLLLNGGVADGCPVLSQEIPERSPIRKIGSSSTSKTFNIIYSSFPGSL